MKKYAYGTPLGVCAAIIVAAVLAATAESLDRT